MTATDGHFVPRAAAIAVVRRLRERGHAAYLAGGCVRDELLGEEPQDFDVATDARPEVIRELFRRTAEVGASFGVMLVREFGPTIEVATFRADGVYSDKRRPDSVEFSDAERDAQRRDFTINALFIDPLESGDDRVIDFVDGRRDLLTRTLRAVGDPERRLAEDHLRALRAVRFAARYGLTIEPGTAAAIRGHAAELEGVSRERIGGEVRRMLTHPSRARACELLHGLRLARAVFGTDAGYEGGAVSGLGDGVSYVAALMALFIGRGHGPTQSAGGLIALARRSLLLSNEDRAALRDGFGALRALVADWDGSGEAWRKRAASGPGFGDALDVLASIDDERAGSVRAEVARLEQRFGGLAPAALVGGEDLIAMGLAPGPAFSRILREVYDAQLEGRVVDGEAARSLARRLAIEPDIESGIEPG